MTRSPLARRVLAGALVRADDARGGGSDGWLLPFQAGGLAWALFGLLDERRRRR